MSSTGAPPLIEAVPSVAVVTVTYNSAAFLEDFLHSCASQTVRDWRMYAIDNASADASVAALRAAAQLEPRLRVTANPRNVGVAEGNNQGIVQAIVDGCEWVLLLNNDTTFAPGLFAEMLRACAERGWKVCVPKMHYDQPADHIWYGGGGFDGRRGHTGYHTAKDEPDTGQCDAAATVDYSPTCCMLVHRSVFETIGMMDETYFVYFDDTDFCWRLRQHGVAIGYWPQATLVHKVGGSTGGVDSPFTARMTARNRLYFLKKHFGLLRPILWLPPFIVYYSYRYLIKQWNLACWKASIQGSFAWLNLTEQVPPLGAQQQSSRLTLDSSDERFGA